ncbi:MAG: class I SAM-dependent methyltransferase [Pseudomonadota bacterium]
MDQDGYFDADTAARYDADHGGADPSDAVRVLAEFAAKGKALEFAIGTGRVALPLSAMGVAVQGIELSEAMVAQMQVKPGAERIPVTIGDMTTTRLEISFDLVFLVFNTINNLTTQEAQVACFQNAARHLAPGGHFFIEVQVPPIQRLPEGETLLAFARDDTHFGTDEIDVVSQRFSSHHVWTEGGKTRTLSVPMRYVWPSELDLMARLAGLEPVHRWADWRKTPFGPTSRAHVSAWRKP